MNYRCAKGCNADEECPEGWACINNRCVSSCVTRADCKRGYRCEAGYCVPMECGTVANPKCPDAQWCDDGICRDLDGKCESWRDCADGYWCNPDTDKCEKKPCTDLADCALGLCCERGECVPCEESSCYNQAQCPDGWYCDPDIDKCRPRECGRHSDCEEGYHCNLEIGKCIPMPKTEEMEEINLEDEEILSAYPCRVGHDTDCRRGQICIGYPVHLLKRILSPGAANGYCGEQDELLIRITGIKDDVTCEYCNALIGNVWPQSQIVLPPYHEHCRCDYEFV